jgi:hypothetical protein
MRFSIFSLSVLVQGCLLLLLSASLLCAAPLTVHVAPFAPGSASPVLAEALFDGFVDQLDSDGPAQGISVELIKVSPAEVDPKWLARQNWIEGSIVAYVEDSGCCATQFQVQARLQSHMADGASFAPLELRDETFFNHDLTTLAAEQVVVGDRLGRLLAVRWLQSQASR